MIELDKIVKKGVRDSYREILRERLSQRPNYLRLDLNEKLQPLSDEQFADMMSRITQDTVLGYPDLAPIYKKMAAFVGVEEDQLLVGTGSDMVVRAVFDAFIEKGDHIVLHDPTYFMYETYANFFEAEVSLVSITTDTWTADAAAMLASVNDKTKLMVIEDPSGFVGTRLPHSELEKLAAALEPKNVLLIIDEAYLYVENKVSPNLDLVEKYGNVILTQTMSKAHGLAGARVGFGISNKTLAGYLYKVRPLYEISGVSARLAEWHIDHPELLDEYHRSIRESKDYLFAELDKLGLKYKDTPANFIVIRFGDEDTAEIIADFKDHGVLPGRRYDPPLLKGWGRMSVAGIDHSRQFIDVLKKII